MRRISRSPTCGLALAVVGLLMMLTAGCALTAPSGGQGSTATAFPTFSPPPFQTPALRTPGPIVGTAAIKPHLSGVPAFTTQDMADYAKGHLPGGSGSSFSIVRNEFLPSADVSGLLGVRLVSNAGLSGLRGGGAALRSDGSILGFLEAHGSFGFPGGVPDSFQTYPYAFEVFDGKTGNLLMYGGLNQPVPNQVPTPTPQPTVQPTPTPTQGAPAPKLSVTPTQTTESCVNGIWPNKLTVKNSGGGTLTWHISSSLPSGISAAPTSGSLGPSASQDVTLSGNGGPSFTITFTSNGGSQNVAINCN